MLRKELGETATGAAAAVQPVQVESWAIESENPWQDAFNLDESTFSLAAADDGEEVDESEGVNVTAAQSRQVLNPQRPILCLSKTDYVPAHFSKRAPFCKTEHQREISIKVKNIGKRVKNIARSKMRKALSRSQS